MNEYIPVNEPLLNGNEKKYLNECIDTGWISSEGPFVKKLENDFSKFCGQKYGVSVCNGSVAIDVAIRAMKEVYGWKEGSEIITPNFTIISCAQSVIYNNLKPVFVDCEPTTYNIDVSKIEDVINKNTVAIMAVHIYGLPCDMDKIFDIAKKYNLKIIEDAAEAHGQFYNGNSIKGYCGGMSDIATFSFYSNKHMTTGEGGMVITSDSALYDKCCYYKNLCFTAENRFVHDDLGWNFRMTNLQAALGVAQLERLKEFIEIKKRMGKMYTEMLHDIPAQLPAEKTSYAENNYWVYPIVLHDDVKFNAKEAMRKLSEKAIGTRAFFYPMNKQPVFTKMGFIDNISCPVSEMIYNKGFYIPSGLALTENQMETVVKKIKEIF